MFDERGVRIEEAGPSTPVSVLGFDSIPSAGDKFNVFEDEKEARAIATDVNFNMGKAFVLRRQLLLGNWPSYCGW